MKMYHLVLQYRATGVFSFFRNDIQNVLYIINAYQNQIFLCMHVGHTFHCSVRVVMQYAEASHSRPHVVLPGNRVDNDVGTMHQLPGLLKPRPMHVWKIECE